MSNEKLAFHSGFYGDDHEGHVAALKNSLARGDFSRFGERAGARRKIRNLERQIQFEKRSTPQGIAERQARAAERQVAAAYVAIGISLISLVTSVLAYIASTK